MEEKKPAPSATDTNDANNVHHLPTALDLPLLMQQVKEGPAWLKGPRNALTVFKSGNLRIVLIALHKNGDLPKHTAPGMISVQVLEGYIRFSTEEKAVDLAQGQLVTLKEHIPHDVLALEESLILLTIALAAK